ncbi:YncE family protein, partial [Paenarthrobacter sp. RAF9]
MADDLTRVVPVGDRPTSVAVNPATNKAYVATFDGVEVVDGELSGGLLYTGDMPVDVAVNPVTNKVFVSEIGGAVAVVDGATRAVTSVPVGANPGVLAVNPVTNKTYVGWQNGVTVIDGATLTATALPLTGAQEIAVNSTTGKVYVLGGGVIKVVGAGGVVTSTISIGAGGILDLAINETTNKIYFTTLGKYGAGVRVIDGITDTVTDTIPTANNVGKLAVNPVTNTVYVAGDSDGIDGFVQVIDPATKTQVAQLRTPTRIRDILVNSAGNKAYALLSGRGVTVVDGDNRFSAVFSGQDPLDAAVNPNTGKVYVSNNGSASVSVIDGSVAAPPRNDFNSDSFADVLARDLSGALWLYP